MWEDKLKFNFAFTHLLIAFACHFEKREVSPGFPLTDFCTSFRFDRGKKIILRLLWPDFQFQRFIETVKCFCTVQV